MAESLEEGLRAVEAFCDSRVPGELRDEIRIECARRGKAITIVERRPPWNPDFGPEWSSVKGAQLRHAQGTWALYWPDSSGHWHEFDEVRPTKTIEPLLGVIQADPTGIFWG